MFYTYVLLCADGRYYVGSTSDIDNRLQEHSAGGVRTTRVRLPVTLVYYEACLSKMSALQREHYFKTGFGRSYLKKRLSVVEVPQTDMGA